MTLTEIFDTLKTWRFTRARRIDLVVFSTAILLY